MTDIKELKDEELEKVSGGLFFVGVIDYEEYPNGSFDIGEIVIDGSGVKYQILNFDEAGSDDKTKWYVALAIHVPESVMSSTTVREGSTHFVNSSFVTHFG